MASTTLEQVLLYRARAWAGQLTALAKSYAPPHLREDGVIQSHVEEGNNGQIVIRITANRYFKPNPGGKGTTTLDARAQEYGSNPHIITGHPYLVFKWDKAEDFIPRTKDGSVILHEVMHPGSPAANEGQGYLRPAIKELRQNGRSELQTDIRRAILGDLRKAFGRKNG